jgi:hypothetical protein
MYLRCRRAGDNTVLLAWAGWRLRKVTAYVGDAVSAAGLGAVNLKTAAYGRSDRLEIAFV